MSKTPSNEHWGNSAEKFYIKNLGNHGMVPRDRRAALERYIELANIRSVWGSIEKEVVVAYAKELLLQCE